MNLIDYSCMKLLVYDEVSAIYLSHALQQTHKKELTFCPHNRLVSVSYGCHNEQHKPAGFLIEMQFVYCGTGTEFLGARKIAKIAI